MSVKAGRPKGHSPSNRGQANWYNREPPRADVPLVRELFAKIDEAGMSLGAFGERCGYSIVSLSQWRHGRSKPQIPALVDMAEAIGYRLEFVPIEADVKIDSGL